MKAFISTPRSSLLYALALSPVVFAQLPPYPPTWILPSSRDESSLYIIRPGAPNGKPYMETVNTGKKLSASGIQSTIISSSLPFTGSDDTGTLAFTPVFEEDGNITVYAGNCSAGARDGQVWSFVPNSQGSGEGKWQKVNFRFRGQDTDNFSTGPKYLSSGISFSSTTKDKGDLSKIYLFGGMCPYGQGNSTEWQSQANYSSSMVLLSQKGSKDGGNFQEDEHQPTVLTSRGGPIAEAGFTATGLLPSFSNASDGTQSKQQNFLMIGGHTSSAFINMSQVALFALPQQSWSFIPIDQPSQSHSELAVRTDVTEVEPRSGHTAVLSADGQKIVVFGGWIGDVDTPAEPQLVVLNVGDGYGGPGRWKWTVPVTHGIGLAKGTGLYGHGATMLPGDIMMVAGGYSISGSSRRTKRAATVSSSNALFYNISSNSWTAEYAPPSQESPVQGGGNSGPLSGSKTKIGLGIGLGVGCAVIAALVALFFWHRRRTKAQREQREKDIHDLALGAQRFPSALYGGGGIDGRGGDMTAGTLMSHSQRGPHNGSGHDQNSTQQGWRNAQAQEAERTGLLVEIPSPTRGLRRSLQTRGHHYHAAPRYDEKRMQSGSSHCHPIDEREEDEHIQGGSDVKGKSVQVPTSDPFEDSDTARSRQVSPEMKNYIHISGPVSPAEERANEFQAWTSDWEIAADKLLNLPQVGRTSPTKSDRTQSTLSDRSTRSNLSYVSSVNGTSSGPSRNLSTRSTKTRGNIQHPAPLKTKPANDVSNNDPFVSPEASPRRVSPTRISLGRRNSTKDDADSFATARSSWAALQAEGENLLGGSSRPDSMPMPITYANSPYIPDSPPRRAVVPAQARPPTALSLDGDASAEDSDIPTNRRKSWVGTVRRALALARVGNLAGGNRDSGETSSFRVLGPSDLRVNRNSSYLPSSTTTDAGPSTDRPASWAAADVPQRMDSDASFWKAKRGRKDWTEQSKHSESSGESGPSDPTLLTSAPSIRVQGTPSGPRSGSAASEFYPGGASSDVGRAGSLTAASMRAGSATGDLSDLDGLGTDYEDEDWDVEAAVERRVVQVMFTVPRQRLRVVNADAEARSIMSLEAEPMGQSAVLVGSDGEERQVTDSEERSSGDGRGNSRDQSGGHGRGAIGKAE